MAAAVDHLRAYLGELSVIRDAPERAPELKPDVDDADKYDDPQAREEEDLARGVVMKATMEEGTGEESPAEGDLVLVHFCCRLSNQTVIASSWSNHGGDDVPLPFLLGKGGRRVPRSWELSVMQMKAGELCLVKAAPEYAYEHPDCNLSRPEGASATERLEFEIRLLTWFPAEVCSAVLADQSLDGGGDVFKVKKEASEGWETPREPFDVELHCTARVPSPTGDLGEGRVLFSTEEGQPLTVTIGAGQVGRRLEAAICSMVEGERSTVLCPADTAAAVSAAAVSSAAAAAAAAEPLLVPSFADEASWVEYDLRLHHIVQVRDMTGNGEVMKRRIRDGEGEFPMDCPLEDCAVRIHYTVSQGGCQVHDTRGSDGTAEPLEFTLGDGTYPAGLEMAVRLMIPMEVSRVSAQPQFAYGKDQGICDQARAVPGVDPSQAVEWDIELLSFDKAPNWHQMEAGERIKVVEDMKAAANALFNAQRYANAKSKYEKAYKITQHTFDAEGDEAEALLKLQVSLELNIATVLYKSEDYTGVITWCNKALNNDPENAKAVYKIGNAYLAAGDYDEAEEAFKMYRELAPSDTDHAESMIVKTSRRRDAAAAKQRKQLRGFMK